MNVTMPPSSFNSKSGWTWILFTAAVLLMFAIGVLVPVAGMESFSDLMSLLAVLGALAVGILVPPIGMACLIALGRTDVGRFSSGFVDLSFWIACGLAIAVIIAAPRWNVRLLGVLPLVSCASFAIVVSTSYLNNIGYAYPRDKAGRILLYLLVYIVFTAYLASDIKRIKLFLLGVLGLAHVAGAVAFVYTAGTSGVSELQRLTLPGSGPVTLARLLGLASIIALGWSASPSIARRNLLRLDSLGLLMLVFLTGSRAPALFLGVCLALFLVIQNLIANPRRRAARLLFTALTLTLAISVARPLLTDSGIPALQRFDLLFQRDRGVSVDVRTANYELALHESEENGYRGSGVGSWAFLMNDGNEIAYPHNFFLETLYENGAVGLLFLFAFLLSIALRSIHSIRSSETPQLSLLLGMLFLFSLLAAQTSGDLFDNRYVFFFGLLAGARIAAPNGYRREQDGMEMSSIDRNRSNSVIGIRNGTQRHG